MGIIRYKMTRRTTKSVSFSDESYSFSVKKAENRGRIVIARKTTAAMRVFR